MRAVQDAVLWVHVPCGFLALVASRVPALTPKGGPTHRGAGGGYVAAMFELVVTAFALAVMLFAHPRAVRHFARMPPAKVSVDVWRLRSVGVFFAALSLLTFTAGWHSLRVLRARRDPRALRTPFNVALHLLNVLFGPPPGPGGPARGRAAVR